MQIYHYDNCFAYVSESEARQDPKVEGAYLIPAYATTVVPPKQERGKASVFDGESWTVVDDFRGGVAFNSENQEVTVSDVGSLESLGLTSEPAEEPELTEDEKKALKVLELEDSITPRNLRGAALGDEFAIAKIARVEAAIAELRG